VRAARSACRGAAAERARSSSCESKRTSCFACVHVLAGHAWVSVQSGVLAEGASGRLRFRVVDVQRPRWEV
jgi:hypothetical protein